jgi:hypothetical protein
MGISTQSPIYLALEGLAKGDKTGFEAKYGALGGEL